MNNDWKPDFNQEDPWAGVPDDYAGIATFVPTESNPEPPWQGETGAESIPDYGSIDYALVAKNIIMDVADKAEAGDQHSAEILQWAKNAADQGAGVASSPLPLMPGGVPTLTPTVKPTALPTNWMLGGLALLAVVAFASGKRKR